MLLLAQEVALYLALQQHSIAPNPLMFSLFVVANIIAPHLLLLHMRKLQQKQRALQHSSMRKAKLEATGAARKDAGGSEGDLGGITGHADANAPGQQQSRLEAKRRQASEDLAAVRGGLQQQQQQQQTAMTTRQEGQHEGTADERTATEGLMQHDKVEVQPSSKAKVGVVGHCLIISVRA
jgi:hypothetical protein